jgi:predicted nuclease of restriction endonuclease-like (RecB) superfamily
MKVMVDTNVILDVLLKRDGLYQKCINSAWSVRELKRQIETSLFERLLLSEGKTAHCSWQLPV